jgi:hypothetical protein
VERERTLEFIPKHFDENWALLLRSKSTQTRFRESAVRIRSCIVSYASVPALVAYAVTNAWRFFSVAFTSATTSSPSDAASRSLPDSTKSCARSLYATVRASSCIHQRSSF